MSWWRTVAQEECERLRLGFKSYSDESPEAVVHKGLGLQALGHNCGCYSKDVPLRNRLGHWWSGTDYERVWGQLYRAGEEFVLCEKEDSLRCRLPSLRAAVDTHLHGEEAECYKKALVFSKDKDLDRYAVHAAVAAVNGALSAAFRALRNYRNLLMLGVGLLTAVAIGAGVWQVLGPGPLSLLPQGTDVFEVELLGAVGGALTGVFGFYRQKGSQETYSLPLVQGLLKIPAGAVTALVGVLVMQAGILGIVSAQEGAKVLGYATLFGMSQQGVTRLIDRRANELLTATSPKSDKPQPPEGSGDRS